MKGRSNAANAERKSISGKTMELTQIVYCVTGRKVWTIGTLQVVAGARNTESLQCKSRMRLVQTNLKQCHVPKKRCGHKTLGSNSKRTKQCYRLTENTPSNPTVEGTTKSQLFEPHISGKVGFKQDQGAIDRGYTNNCGAS